MNNDTTRKIVSNLPTMITKEYYSREDLESSSTRVDSVNAENSNHRNVRVVLIEDRERSLSRLNLRARPGITLE